MAAERPHRQEPQTSPRERYVNVVNDLVMSMPRLRAAEDSARQGGNASIANELFQERMGKKNDIRWLDTFTRLNLGHKEMMKIFDEKEKQKGAEPKTPGDSLADQAVKANDSKWIAVLEKSGLGFGEIMRVIDEKERDEQKHEQKQKDQIVFDDIVQRLQD